jgi:23S rRNA pseudouridine1911/1915/1917 synthase
MAEEIDDLTADSFDDADIEEVDARLVEVTADLVGGRLDKVLAELLEGLSRGRVQAFLSEGRITRDGETVSDASSKAQPGLYQVLVPPVVAAEPAAEDIPLKVLFEDPYLIVIDKAAGMAAHPAPGTRGGTLVNALLHYCGDSLSGIGGVARPGIVHRLDKDTSGVMVAAKTDAAHAGLSALFAAHDIERAYTAFVRGTIHPPRGTIETRIGRSNSDRKKMAVLRSGGREATTHYAVSRIFGPSDKPMASRVRCRLETGRTHQIRVHMASKGAPCLGDPVYGSGSPTFQVKAVLNETGLTRQALHASVLGFVHPVTGETLRFETDLPADLAALEAGLERL